jgi:hypothetical protein
MQLFTSNKYISANNENLFRQVCRNGHFKVAQWLVQIQPKINVSACGESAFRSACENGQLEFAQWLLHIKPTINISLYYNYPFRTACINGQLELAQWLVQCVLARPNPVFICAYKEETYELVCKNKHEKVALWMLQICPTLKRWRFDEMSKSLKLCKDIHRFSPITPIIVTLSPVVTIIDKPSHT